MLWITWNSNFLNLLNPFISLNPYWNWMPTPCNKVSKNLPLRYYVSLIEPIWIRGYIFHRCFSSNQILWIREGKNQGWKNKEKRDMQKHVVKMVNEQLNIIEGESKRKYHRKRLAQSFWSPEEPKRKKTLPRLWNSWMGHGKTANNSSKLANKHTH